MHSVSKFSAVAVMALGFGTTQAEAQSIPPPEGPVILTISGAISITNVADTLQFDRAALRALDDTSFDTSTPWTEDVGSFQGVSLHALTELLDLTEGTLRATAINDYAVEIPVSDAVAGGPIIAHTLDGKEMSIRDKGPLWVIYPFDDNAKYRNATTESRSIWQLDRIDVVK